jgi:hypothetical protein
MAQTLPPRTASRLMTSRRFFREKKNVATIRRAGRADGLTAANIVVFISLILREQLFRSRYDLIGLEAEFFLEFFQWC